MCPRDMTCGTHDCSPPAVARSADRKEEANLSTSGVFQPNAQAMQLQTLCCNGLSSHKHNDLPMLGAPSGTRGSRHCGTSVRNCAHRTKAACHMGGRTKRPLGRTDASPLWLRRNTSANCSQHKEGKAQHGSEPDMCVARKQGICRKPPRKTTWAGLHTWLSWPLPCRNGNNQADRQLCRRGTVQGGKARGKDVGNLDFSHTPPHNCAQSNVGFDRAPRTLCRSTCTWAMVPRDGTGNLGMATRTLDLYRRKTAVPTSECISNGKRPSTCCNSRSELPWIHCLCRSCNHTCHSQAAG
mmetsp:Transcript_24849/g.63201  ORF Transcript_24849/g.63201 Transcript_24849/m.63201 type:complete len:297 (+) Transcript_24849:1167-2057(+)